MHLNFPHFFFFFIYAICKRLYDVFFLHSPRGCVVVVAVGGGRETVCAAPRSVVEAKDAGSRRVHPLPRPCSQLGG